jgi:hypothetical protein
LPGCHRGPNRASFHEMIRNYILLTVTCVVDGV